MIRPLLMSLILLVQMPSISTAASLECDIVETEIEVSICSNPQLIALDELADLLSKYGGFNASFEEGDASYDKISSHYSVYIKRLLGMVDQPSVSRLMKDVANLPSWGAELYPHNVLIIRPKIFGLREVLVVFGEDNYPLVVELEEVVSPISFKYSLKNGTIFVAMTASVSNGVDKYRWQNNCWRLIGEEGTFNHRGYNPSNDPIGWSINHLTGQELLYFENGNSVSRDFNPEVWCISSGKNRFEIGYHKTDK